MERLRHSLALAALLLSVAASTLAQQQQALVRYDNIALTWTYVSGVRVSLPIPNASILVCTANAVGTPCSPKATVYTDPAGQFPAPNPLTADSRGNYGFYAPPGRYVVQISGPTVQMYQMVIDVPLTPPLDLSVSSNITGVLPIASGGTGASTGAGALTNLNAAASGSCPSGQVMTSVSSTGPTCVPLSNLIGPTSLRAPSSTFLCSGPSGSDGLCAMPSSTSQNGATTIAEGFAPQPPSVALMGPLVPPGAAVGVVNWGYCTTTQVALNRVSCTATLPSATTAGNALLVMQCSHNNSSGCGSSGGAPTDQQGDTFVMSDFKGFIWYAANIVGGTTSVTCNLPVSSSATNGVAGCIVLELANAGGVDVYSNSYATDLSCSSGGSCGITASAQTTTARDTIFIMYTAGHNGDTAAAQCAPKSVTVSPFLGVILGGRFDQPNAWPLWVWWATYPGVDVRTYYFSIDTGVNDCTGSSAPTAPMAYMISIKPASGTVPTAKPTWRFVSAMDVQAGFGNFGSGVTGVGYQVVQYNGVSLPPRATLNFISSNLASPVCTDDTSSARTNCKISPSPSVVAYGRAVLSSNMSMTTGQNVVLSVSVTMPSSGCPCRALISYGLYIGATSSATWDAWVTDGTNIFAQVDGQTTDATQLPLSGSEVTYVTYNNGQVITFNLIFNLPSGVSSGWTANASPHAGSEPSHLTVAVLPSVT
jgi:hypothetical protein